MEPSSASQFTSSGATTGTSSGTHQTRSGGREKFGAEELAIALSHFSLGVVDSIVEFPRGSRKAPKLLIVAEHGKFLLKRRARGKDDPFKVAFCHAIQLHLAAKQFPLPHLIGTTRDNNSMLQWRGSVYEMFEYIPGQSYPHTLEGTFDSGRVLGLYHKLLESFVSEWQPSGGSYHSSPAVETGLRSIPKTVPGAGEGETLAMLEYLLTAYSTASDNVQKLGIENWPKQIVHADWHPGNMLYRDNRVVAVIDYDSARQLPRIVDISNGALQFSIIGGEDDVSKWPDYLDESRFKRFLRGYDDVALLSQAEIQCLPWLMIQALVAEAVFPIAATGTFGRMDGQAFLQMVQRKIAWLQRSAKRLAELAEG